MMSIRLTSICTSCDVYLYIWEETSRIPYNPRPQSVANKDWLYRRFQAILPKRSFTYTVIFGKKKHKSWLMQVFPRFFTSSSTSFSSLQTHYGEAENRRERWQWRMKDLRLPPVPSRQERRYHSKQRWWQIRLSRKRSIVHTCSWLCPNCCACLCRHATACIKDKRLAVLEYKRAFFILKTY